MPEPHVIRLRGPWELQPLVRFVATGDGQVREEAHDLPCGGKVQVPGDWGDLLGQDFLGVVRYTRRFNCPTNLESHETVWLALDGADYQASVMLNGLPIGQVPGARPVVAFDITRALELHNVLAVDVSLPAAVFNDAKQRPGRAGLAGGLIGEVRLEIRRTVAE